MRAHMQASPWATAAQACTRHASDQSPGANPIGCHPIECGADALPAQGSGGPGCELSILWRFIHAIIDRCEPLATQRAGRVHSDLAQPMGAGTEHRQPGPAAELARGHRPRHGICEMTQAFAAHRSQRLVPATHLRASQRSWPQGQPPRHGRVHGVAHRGARPWRGPGRALIESGWSRNGFIAALVLAWGRIVARPSVALEPQPPRRGYNADRRALGAIILNMPISRPTRHLDTSRWSGRP